MPFLTRVFPLTCTFGKLCLCGGLICWKKMLYLGFGSLFFAAAGSFLLFCRIRLSVGGLWK